MRRIGLITVLAVFLVLPALAVPAAAKAKTLKLGTTFPKASPWGKVLAKMAKTVRKKSRGKLKIKIYYAGAQGDEVAMVDKLKRRKLHALAVTSVGLSYIYKDSLIFEMPGLVGDWSTLDQFRKKLLPAISKGIRKAGFRLMAHFDVGLVRYMSKRKKVTTPDDLRALKVFRWGDDPITPTARSVIAFSGPKGALPGLHQLLLTGRVTAIAMPAALAVSFKWTSHLDHIAANPVGVQVGGLLFSNRALSKLPRGLRNIVKRAARKAGKSLKKSIRRQDDRAYQRLRQTMTGYNQTSAWGARFKAIRAKLKRSRVFDPALIAKAEALAGK